jgi:hypothetical protein
MPRATWPLRNGRPVVSVLLTLAATGHQIGCNLLADTGAGAAHVGFEVLLQENDCHRCGGIPAQGVLLGGAYVGSFPVFVIRVQIPALSFDHYVRAVGVPQVPTGLDGVAAFRFLNRFTYGNFGMPQQFGLET